MVAEYVVFHWRKIVKFFGEINKIYTSMSNRYNVRNHYCLMSKGCFVNDNLTKCDSVPKIKVFFENFWWIEFLNK